MRTITLRKFVFILPIFSIIACNTNFSPNDFCQNGETKRKWEEQIYHAMTNKTRSGSDVLALISCGEKNTITSNMELEDAIEQIFATESYITIQNPIDYSFVITTIGQINENSNNSYTELKTSLLTKANKDLSEGKSLRLLELEWSYKDSTYLSHALVTDEDGVLFETIGYFIVINEDMNNSPIKRVKTRSEYAGGGSTDDSEDNSSSELPETKYFTKSFTVENLLKIEVVSVNINCSSTFNSKGILVNRERYARGEAAIGFQCSAGIETISGTINIDNYHEFAWGYHYGPGITASLSWNGIGFTVGGGGTKATGSKIHRKGID